MALERGDIRGGLFGCKSFEHLFFTSRNSSDIDTVHLILLVFGFIRFPTALLGSRKRSGASRARFATLAYLIPTA